MNLVPLYKIQSLSDSVCLSLSLCPRLPQSLSSVSSLPAVCSCSLEFPQCGKKLMEDLSGSISVLCPKSHLIKITLSVGWQVLWFCYFVEAQVREGVAGS